MCLLAATALGDEANGLLVTAQKTVLDRSKDREAFNDWAQVNKALAIKVEATNTSMADMPEGTITCTVIVKRWGRSPILYEKYTETQPFPPLKTSAETRLTIGNRGFDCTHPVLAMPVRPDTALAYSCNCFVAHMAERFDPGELSRELETIGLAAPTGLIASNETSGRIANATTLDAVRMQAIGEAGVVVTPLELAFAYRQLARRTGREWVHAKSDPGRARDRCIAFPRRVRADYPHPDTVATRHRRDVASWRRHARSVEGRFPPPAADRCDRPRFAKTDGCVA